MEGAAPGLIGLTVHVLPDHVCRVEEGLVFAHPLLEVAELEHLTVWAAKGPVLGGDVNVRGLELGVLESGGSPLGFALAVVGIISVLLIPVPKMLLDFLLGISMTLSVLVLMTVLFLKRPLDFTTFPPILLITALFRLSLNIASTRLILSHGNDGPQAAGNVIAGFANFVMGGDFVIGTIVFVILITVNFLVITKGATRIAEVGARFTLDAIP